MSLLKEAIEGTVAVSDYTVAADLQDLGDKIKSMMEVGEIPESADLQDLKKTFYQN